MTHRTRRRISTIVLAPAAALGPPDGSRPFLGDGGDQNGEQRDDRSRKERECDRRTNQDPLRLRRETCSERARVFGGQQPNRPAQRPYADHALEHHPKCSRNRLIRCRSLEGHPVPPPGTQFGTAVPSVGGLAGFPSSRSLLKAKAPIRSPFRCRLGLNGRAQRRKGDRASLMPRTLTAESAPSSSL
jgi:hypothetical protein